MKTVAIARRKFGRSKLCGQRYIHIPWRELDWTKSDTQLSRELKVKFTQVRSIREKLRRENHAIQKSNGSINRKSKITEEEIQSINWALTRDIDIAKNLRVTRERIRQIREERGFPRCQLHVIGTYEQDFERWLLENKESISGKLASIVADECPLTLAKHRKYAVMRKSSIPFVWRRKQEHRAKVLPINWKLPNLIIALVWGGTPNWPATARNNLSIGKSSYYSGSGNVSNLFYLKSFTELVRAEVKKAIEVGVKPNMDRLTQYGYTE